MNPCGTLTDCMNHCVGSFNPSFATLVEGVLGGLATKLGSKLPFGTTSMVGLGGAVVVIAGWQLGTNIGCGFNCIVARCVYTDTMM